MSILFIGNNRIGDAVLASGVLAQLIERHPGARITIACGPLPAALFADTPGLERLHLMTKKKRSGHWLTLWKACIGRHWAVVCDMRGSAFAWTVRADRRLVVGRGDRMREHRVEDLARQLALATLPAPKLWVSAERDRRAVARLGDGPVLAIGPTANWGAKQWPAERFAEALTRLTAADGILPGARIAVFGAANERRLAQPVLGAIPPERLIDLIGGSDLLDAYAMLRHCSFYLGNDSGMMHMAAAAGIPTLGLFGPSPEWRYGPWGPKAAVIRTPESYEALVSENPAFDHLREDTLMGGLTVEAVVEAAHDLWSRCQIGASV